MQFSSNDLKQQKDFKELIDEIDKVRNQNSSNSETDEKSKELNSDSVKSITEEENKLLNLTYKINKDGIFETDMKTVFEMLKNGVTLEEITNKINDLLDN